MALGKDSKSALQYATQTVAIGVLAAFFIIFTIFTLKINVLRFETWLLHIMSCNVVVSGLHLTHIWVSGKLRVTAKPKTKVKVLVCKL